MRNWYGMMILAFCLAAMNVRVNRLERENAQLTDRMAHSIYCGENFRPPLDPPPPPSANIIVDCLYRGPLKISSMGTCAITCEGGDSYPTFSNY